MRRWATSAKNTPKVPTDAEFNLDGTTEERDGKLFFKAPLPHKIKPGQVLKIPQR